MPGPQPTRMSDRLRSSILQGIVREAWQYAREVAAKPTAPESVEPMRAAAKVEAWKARIQSFEPGAKAALGRAELLALGAGRRDRAARDRLRTRHHQLGEIRAALAQVVAAAEEIDRAFNGPDEVLSGMAEMIDRMLKGGDGALPSLGGETQEVVVKPAHDGPMGTPRDPGPGASGLDALVLVAGFLALVIDRLRTRRTGAATARRAGLHSYAIERRLRVR